MSQLALTRLLILQIKRKEKEKKRSNNLAGYDNVTAHMII